MNKKDIIKQMHQSIVKGNLDTYRELFMNTNINEAADSYWKKSLRFYTELSNETKEILFKIIEQIEVDTLSTILGVIDEGMIVGEKVEVEFKLTVNNTTEPINGDLQDLFLEYDEATR